MEKIIYEEQHYKQLIKLIEYCFPHTSITVVSDHVHFDSEVYDWFEFTMTHLTSKTYEIIYEHVKETKKPKNIFEQDIFYTQVLTMKTIHPIEYLYDSLKSIKPLEI